MKQRQAWLGFSCDSFKILLYNEALNGTFNLIYTPKLVEQDANTVKGVHVTFKLRELRASYVCTIFTITNVKTFLKTNM